MEKKKINFECSMIILKCSLDENVRRMIEDGREENHIQRGIDSTFHFYDRYDYPAIDTIGLEIDQVIDCIADLVGIGRELLRHGFENLKLNKIWCGYFEGNTKSKHVQEKCGFAYHHTNKDIDWKLMGDIWTEQVTCMGKEDWYSVK